MAQKKPRSSQPPTIDTLELKRLSLESGLDLCGVAPASELDGFGQRLDLWIEQGRHGAMAYMERWRDKRSDPRKLLPGAQSVVSVAVAYKPDTVMPAQARIAQYAYNADYHEVVKTRLYALVAALRERYQGFEAKVCVDTAPISDKLWAARAGLGWIGRNTLLVTPQFGSYVNLGELVTPSAFTTYDEPLADGCGSCRRCLDACVSHAIDDTSRFYGVKATECTAYQTVEPTGEPSRSRKARAGYIFGCDLCQTACPYCIESPAVRHISPSRQAELEALASSDESTFRRLAEHTSLSRIDYAHWRKNLE